MGNWQDEENKVWKNLEDSKKRWLGRNVKLGIDDLAEMTVADIAATFVYDADRHGHKKPGVNDAKLTRTFIWQCWLKIRTGEMKPISGNLRSFWYREYDPFYVRLGMLSRHWTDPSPEDKMAMARLDLQLPRTRPRNGWNEPLDPWEAAEAFDLAPPSEWERLMAVNDLSTLTTEERKTVLVVSSRKGRATYLLNLMTHSFDIFVEKKYFQFQDEFDFQDPRKNFRVIGKDRPRVLFFTEKEGLFKMVKTFANKKGNGISAMASHGESHWLSTAFFADDLEKIGVTHLLIGAVTDYDPWGYMIAENIAKKLVKFGFKVDLWKLTKPSLFTDEQLKKGTKDFSDMSKAKQTQADKWYKKTHGVNGQKAAIHIDLADWDTIEKAAQKWLDSL